jgi:hypothetical protein
MCRDRFAHQGKSAIHILDLVFANGSSDPAARPDPGFSQRQEGRARLKARLLREVWGEKESIMESAIALCISEEVKSILEKRMILVDEVRRTIEHAEETNDKIQNPASGRILASFRPSCVTYWVEYSSDGAAFAVHDAYSHRMEVH